MTKTFVIVEEDLCEVASEALADQDEDFMEWCLSGTVMAQAASEVDEDEDVVSWTVLA